MELAKRFWLRVEKSDGCWRWTGPPNPKGYGQFWINDLGRSLGPHVVAYRLCVDPGYQGDLDHTCHTYDQSCQGGATCPHRLCVRPDHLEPVTRGENSRRGKSRLTHCKHGHEWTEENTRITPKGERSCRACARDRALAYSRTPAGQAQRKKQDAKRKLARARAKVARLEAEQF